MTLRIVPIEFSEACAFVALHHRHHRPPQGHKFSIACLDTERNELCGVAIVGRPVSRNLDDGWTLEVTRLCSDGTRNVCSKLYSRCRRIAGQMGFKKVVTYILAEESGASLLAAGFQKVATSGGGSWSRENRQRVDKHPMQAKLRFEATI